MLHISIPFSRGIRISRKWYRSLVKVGILYLAFGNSQIFLLEYWEKDDHKESCKRREKQCWEYFSSEIFFSEFPSNHPLHEVIRHHRGNNRSRRKKQWDCILRCFLCHFHGDRIYIGKPWDSTKYIVEKILKFSEKWLICHSKCWEKFYDQDNQCEFHSGKNLKRTFIWFFFDDDLMLFISMFYEIIDDEAYKTQNHDALRDDQNW